MTTVTPAIIYVRFCLIVSFAMSHKSGLLLIHGGSFLGYKKAMGTW